jgi:invasion protein IalB
MSKPFGPLFVAALMAVSASGSVAQEASPSPDALSETYGDWVVVCNRAPTEDNQPGPRLCEMTQELRQQEGGQRVLSLALRPEENVGAAFLTLLTPFGMKLSDPVALEIDGATVLQAPFHTCVPAGCVVQAQIDPTTLDIISTGEAAVVRLPTIAGEPFQVTISLLGFTTAWTRLNEF